MSRLPIKGFRTTVESVEIEVWPSDAYDVLVTALKEKYGLNKDQWVSDGFVWEEEDCGPHRPTDKKLRSASPVQERLMAAIEEIRKLLVGV
jgi:hypothetical protein